MMIVFFTLFFIALIYVVIVAIHDMLGWKGLVAAGIVAAWVVTGFYLVHFCPK